MAQVSARVTQLGSATAMVTAFLLGCGSDPATHSPNSNTSVNAGAGSSSTAAGGNAVGASTMTNADGLGGTTATTASATNGGAWVDPANASVGGAATGGVAASSTTGSGGTQPASATSSVALDFDGIPKVGASAPASVSGAPAGTVSSVSAAASGYTSVTIRFPAEWQCPADATSSTSVTTTTPTATSSIAMAAADCHTLAALRRPTLKTDALNQLTSVRRALVSSKCLERVETRCVDATGKNVASYNCMWATAGAGGAMASTGGSPPPGTTYDSTSAKEYSTTNTQVATVDEADYVKNDGQTIYVLGTDGLRVIDAWPAPETRQIALVPIPGEPRRLFLSDNRLVVYSRMQAGSASGVGSSNPSDQGCTYGYDCRFTSEGGHTLAIVYDVSTPAQPVELMRYEMSGGYVASRRVGAFVYTVVHDTGAPQIPGLDYTLSANGYDELLSAFATRAAANAAAIDAQSDDYFLPWVQSTLPNGTKSVVSECGQALMGPEARGMSFVSVAAFDLTKLQAPTRTVLGSNPGYVYASPEALYFAVDQVPEPTSTSDYYYYGRNAVNSVVHKFALQGTEVRYKGSAALPGHILNQFAMDERQGVLRVASTAGWVPSTNVVSYLTTYAESDGTLKQLGQLGGIAPTEDIRSVRFDDDRGFVVTFKKTDPLFIFDLESPATPKLLGELKIPGFSTYMHRLDRDHLLAVGFEADDQGSFAYFNGIQIQIFDVTDLANPTLLHKRVIGTRGSGSEALTNHLAFNYFPPQKMLALPITVCEGGGNGTFGDQLTFAGLMAFDISLSAGITEHGRLPFIDPTTVGITESCGKWWTDASSLVKRSIFMDDWVYGLSDAQLRVANLGSMSQPAAAVKLTK
ncbi:MAG TPA: beta-propeller domain-containing protein [Polyangiaceae bacterium]